MKKIILSSLLVLGSVGLVAGCQAQASNVDPSAIKARENKVKNRESKLEKAESKISIREDNASLHQSTLNKGSQVAKSAISSKIIPATKASNNSNSAVSSVKNKATSSSKVSNSNKEDKSSKKIDKDIAISLLIKYLKDNDKYSTNLGFMNNGVIEQGKDKGYMINVYKDKDEMPSGSYFVNIETGAVSKIW